MPDRERVIYDIERCICHVPDACRDCSYFGETEVVSDCMEKLLAAALELLKEQEEKETHPCKNCQEYECDGCPYADD